MSTARTEIGKAYCGAFNVAEALVEAARPEADLTWDPAAPAVVEHHAWYLVRIANYEFWIRIIADRDRANAFNAFKFVRGEHHLMHEGRTTR